ncbi:MAG: VWA domain-containing protein [Acidobacteria bacterium]|nr:VWA domain-containing protein [Acidobacteriota bacterium]
MYQAVLSVLLPLVGQTNPPETTIRTNSLEVVVDLVVRDKRGRPLKDLQPAEIVVQSESKAYPIKSLRWVSPAASAAASLSASPTESKAITKEDSDPLRAYRFVTILFEQLPRESAKLAFDATNALIEKATAPNLFFSVFLARERLKLVQGFTADPVPLKQAIKAVTLAAGFKQSDDLVALAENQLKSLAGSGQELEQFMRGQIPNPTVVGGPGAAPVDAGQFVRAQQVRIALDMMGMADSFQRQDRGRVSLNSLRAAINAVANLPGRKTIVYVCRGLGSHPSLMPVFQRLIEAANSKGVSIYGIDVTGLEQSERTREAANMLARAAAASTATLSAAGDKAVSREEAMAFETAEQSALANPTTLLAELASATGGLVLSDTNDSRKIAQQIAEDITSHWELTYNPEVESFDGAFHPIAVKVKRKDAKVQARKGFFALAPGDNRSVEPFETSLLKALSEKEAPTAVSFDAQLLDVYTENGVVHGEVVVETPIAEMDLEELPIEKVVRLKSAVLAFLRDEKGEIRERLSQQIDWKAPLDQIEKARSGTLQWHRSFTAPPGKYTLEIAMADRQSTRLGVKRIPVVLEAAPAGQLSLGAISRVRPEAAASPSHPAWLKFNSTALTPFATAKAPLAGSASSLSLLLVLQPANSGLIELEAQIVRDGQEIARLPIPLDEATGKAKGRFSYVVSLPTEILEPGSYKIQINARQGTQQATRSIQLQLDPAPEYKPPARPLVSSVEAPKPVELTMRSFAALDPDQKLNSAEQQILFERVKQTGRQWADGLINFTCLQLTDRFFDRQGNDGWKKSDTIREMVTYYNGKESYEDLSPEREATKSIRSFGEFGGMMRIVVGSKVNPAMEWRGYVEIDGRRLHRIGYSISKANSGYRMTRENPFEQYMPAYEGELFVEVDSLLIRRITLRTQAIPERFSFQDATHEIDYDFTRIGGQSYLLPVKSVMQTRVGKRKLVRSEINFSNYRKWSSDTKIQFDTQGEPASPQTPQNLK